MSTEKASDPHDQRGLRDSPFLAERLLRESRLGGDGPAFSSDEELRAALASPSNADLQERRMLALRDDPVEMAQELAFQAYECDVPEQALDLADKALALDPDCIDAQTIRAFVVSEDAGDLIAALERAVDSGEKGLGEEFFAEHIGDFWALVEARPYMRTLKHLAEVYWETGRRLDSAAQYETLLELDGRDHMSNNVLLLSNYLSMGEVQRAWDLLEEYDDDESALYAWAWVLLFLLTGDEEAALDALDHALDLNPFVAPWFIGMGDDEEQELGPVVPRGGEAEARLCDQILGEAWDRTPDAQDWLFDVLEDMGLVAAEDADGDEKPQRPN